MRRVLSTLATLALLVIAVMLLNTAAKHSGSEASASSASTKANTNTESTFITPAIPKPQGTIVEATETQVASAAGNSPSNSVGPACKPIDMGNSWRYVDLGTAAGDACITQGFQDENTSPFPFTALPVKNDTSAIYQQAGVHNIVLFPTVTPNKAATVIVAVEKGRLGDSWTLSINGQQVATSKSEWSLPGIYRINVPANLITGDTLTLDFNNTMSKGDPENSNTYGVLVYQNPS